MGDLEGRDVKISGSFPWAALAQMGFFFAGGGVSVSPYRLALWDCVRRFLVAFPKGTSNLLFVLAVGFCL